MAVSKSLVQMITSNAKSKIVLILPPTYYEKRN